MKIKDIAQIVNGSTPSTSNQNFWGGTIPWITPKNLSTLKSRYVSRGERDITRSGYDSCSTTLVPKDTVLLTSRAPIGYLAIAANPICTNQGFKSIVCSFDVLPLYMYYYLTTKVELLKSLSSGSTFKELSKEQLESIEIPLPPLSEQQHIVYIRRYC